MIMAETHHRVTVTDFVMARYIQFCSSAWLWQQLIKMVSIGHNISP